MALICKPSSSVAPLDETPWKIKVQLMRVWKDQGVKKRSGMAVDMVLLESVGSKIHTRIDEALSKWIKDINDEKMDGGDADIDIPKEVLPMSYPDRIKTIVNEVYGESYAKTPYYSRYFSQDKVILCHTDDDVDQINNYMLSQLPGINKLCYSDDCVTPADVHNVSPVDFLLVPPETFACIPFPGMPPQILKLKVGAPVVLLTDIDTSRGLCKGTRLIITEFGDSMLLACFAKCGVDCRRDFLIPKTHMFSDPSELPMRRTQYPFKLAFAMTINQSLGHTFSKVGLYLPRQVFLQGQRYLAISKVKTTSGLTQVLITNKKEEPQEVPDNVVLRKLFENY